MRCVWAIFVATFFAFFAGMAGEAYAGLATGPHGAPSQVLSVKVSAVSDHCQDWKGAPSQGPHKRCCETVLCAGVSAVEAAGFSIGFRPSGRPVNPARGEVTRGRDIPPETGPPRA